MMGNGRSLSSALRNRQNLWATNQSIKRMRKKFSISDVSSLVEIIKGRQNL